MNKIPGLSDKDWEWGKTIYGFTETYLLHRYDNPAPIPDCHLEWWAMLMSPAQQVAIAAPREHAKSSAVTFAYLLFIILWRLSRHTLLLGSTEELAAGFLTDIKTELEENEVLCKDHGVKQMIKATETEVIILFNDGTKSRIIAKGSGPGKRMRGLKWERKRPDTVIFDDMEDEEMVLNAERRRKFKEWFYGTVRPITSQGGKIRGVGTIIGYDSFLQKTMPNEKDKKNTIIEPLRTYSRKPQGGWLSVKYRGHSTNMEELLWPENRTKEYFRNLRKEYAAMGLLDIYGQEILNDPIDSTTAFFKKADFLPMKDEDHHSRKTFTAGIDLAISQASSAAFSAMVVGGMDQFGVLHIVDIRRGRWDGLEIIDELFSITQRWDADMLLKIEQENIARSIGASLNREQEERGIFLNIDDEPPTKDKTKRARGIQIRMRAGKVKFDKEADWYPDFEEELTRFPKGQFVDQVDAFAWLGLAIDDMISPDTDEELEEQQYHEAFSVLRTGRSKICGY